MFSLKLAHTMKAGWRVVTVVVFITASLTVASADKSKLMAIMSYYSLYYTVCTLYYYNCMYNSIGVVLAIVSLGSKSISLW